RQRRRRDRRYSCGDVSSTPLRPGGDRTRDGGGGGGGGGGDPKDGMWDTVTREATLRRLAGEYANEIARIAALEDARRRILGATKPTFNLSQADLVRSSERLSRLPLHLRSPPLAPLSPLSPPGGGSGGGGGGGGEALVSPGPLGPRNMSAPAGGR